MNPDRWRIHRAVAFLALFASACAGCASRGGAYEEGEPVIIEKADQDALQEEHAEKEEEAPKQLEGEVPIDVVGPGPPVAVAPDQPTALDQPEEVVITAAVRQRYEVIRDLVTEAQNRLRDVELQYFFTTKRKKELLRGRPVAFALWSELKSEWLIAHIEIPPPPIRWKPGRKPLPFIVRTPGIQARHVKGTGAERLMFTFSKDAEQLKVYGRKFPVFDSALIAKKNWRAAAQTAKPIVYLPFTEDTLDPLFISNGRKYLLATAQKAIDELRLADAPSVAFRGELLADVVPAEVITTLAVIEQTDDADFVKKKADAFNEVLSHYGLKGAEAYRYSVSRASALGPMQFTNRRGNGTYAFVVRRCPEAKLDPNFERGATDTLNAMKAAICLFDLELAEMSADIRIAYRENAKVLGIFPVAAYNGGPRNVRKLYKVMQRMRVKLEDLRLPGADLTDSKVICPCLWRAQNEDVVPVAIPRYNNENRWYIEKYQNILRVFE
jgi:hypothetical protein